MIPCAPTSKNEHTHIKQKQSHIQTETWNKYTRFCADFPTPTGARSLGSPEETTSRPRQECYNSRVGENAYIFWGVGGINTVKYIFSEETIEIYLTILQMLRLLLHSKLVTCLGRLPNSCSVMARISLDSSVIQKMSEWYLRWTKLLTVQYFGVKSWRQWISQWHSSKAKGSLGLQQGVLAPLTYCNAQTRSCE